MRDGKKAYGVMVKVRENDLVSYSYQKKFAHASSNDAVLAREAFELFCEKHVWREPLRSVAISGIYLDDRNAPEQLDIFCDGEHRAKLDRLDETIDEINNAYGFGTITRAACIAGRNNPRGHRRELIMPNSRYMAG
jgi:DNA polymerase-4